VSIVECFVRKDEIADIIQMEEAIKWLERNEGKSIDRKKNVIDTNETIGQDTAALVPTDGSNSDSEEKPADLPGKKQTIDLC
jgi:hypothetical protein